MWAETVGNAPAGCGLQADHWRASGRFQISPKRLETPGLALESAGLENIFDFIRLICKREKTQRCEGKKKKGKLLAFLGSAFLPGRIY